MLKQFKIYKIMILKNKKKYFLKVNLYIVSLINII